MFRAVAPRIRVAAPRRTFVSTVLLTRDWESATVNSLKTELRKRGLLQTGNKATLITRLQEYERERSTELPPPAVHQLVRSASTTTATEVPGIPSTSKPSPIPPSYPTEFLDVKIPNTNIILPETPIQVPFVPDFWDSSRVKAESAPPKPEEPSTPKVLAVAGAATHIGGGPTHALYSQLTTESTSAPAEPSQQSAFSEFLNDLLPGSLHAPSREAPEQFLESLSEPTFETGRHFERRLDETEKKGVYGLLGVLAASVLAGGIFAPSPAIVEKVEKPAPEKTAEQH